MKKPGFGLKLLGIGYGGERGTEPPRSARLEVLGKGPGFCQGSHRGVAASQLPAWRGSPDIGEQKLSVPVATVAPAAAKFRGGGRRAAESPPPPPPPSRHRPLGWGPPLVPFLGVCRRPAEPLAGMEKAPREAERPSLLFREGGAAVGGNGPLPSALPTSSRDWMEGVHLLGCQSSGRGSLRTPPSGRCRAWAPGGPERGSSPACQPRLGPAASSWEVEGE